MSYIAVIIIAYFAITAFLKLTRLDSDTMLSTVYKREMLFSEWSNNENNELKS
jgi:hypothetical protein